MRASITQLDCLNVWAQAWLVRVCNANRLHPSTPKQVARGAITKHSDHWEFHIHKEHGYLQVSLSAMITAPAI
jgi:hypothetical protein